MKDIPAFTTENGAASLVLREIPYRQVAYIKVHSSESLTEFMEDCVGFCRAVGAERVYGSGHSGLVCYPFYTAIWKMTCRKDNLPQTDACLWPVQEGTLGAFRELYNRRMDTVPNAAWMTAEDGKKMMEKGDGYFIHRGDMLLGIGRASGDTLDSVIAAQPGAGADVVAALAHALTEEQVYLTVASANERAVRLYKKLGFNATAEISKWYHIF